MVHKHPHVQPPASSDFSSVALMARSPAEGVMGSFVSGGKCTKGVAPFVQSWRKSQHAAEHAEALGITLLDGTQQSMHDPVTKNFCHLLTWEMEAKKRIG